MALERLMEICEGILTKLTHIETRLMHSRLRGHEFIRQWMNSVSDFDETFDKFWLRRQTGDLIGSLMDSRPPKKKQNNTKHAKNKKKRHHLSIPSKNELVRFYLSVAILRMHVGESMAELNKVKRLAEWETEAHAHFGKWPWGE